MAMTDRGGGPRFAVVSAGVLTIAVTYGLARYGFGLFVPELRAAFDLSASAIGLLATGAYAVYLAATALTAWATPRLELRSPVVAAGALAAVGMGLIAIARDPFTMTAGVLIAGASSGIAYPPFSQAVKRLLPESQQSTAVALINSGTSYGVLVSGPLALVVAGEWRLAWLLFALLAVATTLWSAVVLPRDTGVRHAERTAIGASTALFSRRSAPLFAAALTVGFGTSVYWTFAVDLIAREGTLPPEAGRVLVVLIGIAGIAGGFTGAAVRRFGVRTFYVSTGALGSALLVLALEAGAWAPVGVSGVMFGAAYFAATAYLGLWSLRLFPDQPAAGFSATFFLISVGQLIGPFPAGLLADAAGLQSAFYVGAGLTLATLLFASPLGNPGCRSGPPSDYRPRRIRHELAATSRVLADRGLLPGTAGNLSFVLSRDPFRAAITTSGVDKGALRAKQILIVDENGVVLEGHGEPSYEMPLHLTILGIAQSARAVIHTHSVWSVLASQRDASATAVLLANYEQLKGLEGVSTHEHEEIVPIVDNDRDMASMSCAVAGAIDSATHAVLLRGHGLYTWAGSLAAAQRHVETLEFLLEADVRSACAGTRREGD